MFLATRDSFNFSLHSWSRYIAHLHLVKFKKHTIVVPLDRIDDRFEYIEEIRFENYLESPFRRGLLGYIAEFHDLVHQATLGVNKVDVLGRLHALGIEKLPIPTNGNRTIFPYYAVPWDKYFPSYTVSGIIHNRVKYVLHSPYKDEIHNFSGFKVTRLEGFDRPKVNITRIQ